MKYNRILNTAKLTAGSIALLYDFDVDTAVGSAGEAVRWNGLEHVLLPHEIDEMMNNPNYSKEQLEAIKSIPANIAAVHNYYNDMTIVSLSGGMAGYTVIINNKSGEVWVSNYSDIGISLNSKNIKELENAIKVNPSGKISKSVGFGTSINFGSIKGGKMTAEDINEAIKGTSLGIQACQAVCVGSSRTAGKDAKTIYTYGVGTPQFGLTGGKMVKTDIVLTKENIDELLKIR